MNVDILRNYLHSTKDDWNYITPIDFYNNYYLKRRIIFSSIYARKRNIKKCTLKAQKIYFG